MEVHVSLDGDLEDRDGRPDLSGQIYRQLRSAILDGRLRPGDTLPPTRELAVRLAVARNTVIVAYDKLVGEGFVVTRVGAGTYVSEELRLPATAPPGEHDAPPAPRKVWTRMPEPPDLTTEPEFDFRPGLGDARLFPYQSWRRLVTTELRAANAGNAGYSDPAGHLDLRTAIARHVGVSRSVRVTPGDVVVSSGTQQAVDLIGRVLLEPGDTVAVEDPGYPPIRRLFESLGANIACVPVDAEGLVVSALPERTRLVFVTPSHQFPLGMPMSLPRRLALLAWAEQNNAVLVEDDYDSEFRFTGRPIEPLQSLDRTGRVIYVGTFSKVLLPTLRLGFLVAPPSLRQALRTAKYVTDWHSPLTNQVALARFIEEGTLSRHIRKMRNTYRERHERITTSLARDFRSWLTPVPSVAGLHITAYLEHHVDEKVVEQAQRVGVQLPALSWFAVDRTAVRSGIILGYGAIQTHRIDEGMRRLRHILSTGS